MVTYLPAASAFVLSGAAIPDPGVGQNDQHLTRVTGTCLITTFATATSAALVFYATPLSDRVFVLDDTFNSGVAVECGFSKCRYRTNHFRASTKG
jgi:hypothetical protein